MPPTESLGGGGEGKGVGGWGIKIRVSHHGLVGIHENSLFIYNQATKTINACMHVLQVVLWYTSMTNEVHLNGMNKMEAFSHDEGYLHLCISEPIGLLLYTM